MNTPKTQKDPVKCTKCNRIFKHEHSVIPIKGRFYCHKCKFEIFERMPQWTEKGLALIFGTPKEVNK